jgi:hypothetical protein
MLDKKCFRIGASAVAAIEAGGMSASFFRYIYRRHQSSRLLLFFIFGLPFLLYSSESAGTSFAHQEVKMAERWSLPKFSSFPFSFSFPLAPPTFPLWLPSRLLRLHDGLLGRFRGPDRATSAALPKDTAAATF